MNPLYLSRIEISNFRTYGEDFSIDLPEQPGMTVLCGMNGLGKTAFFDAIEWALLGEIQRLPNDRLRKSGGNPLTREGTPIGCHRVDLSWGDNQKITRTETRTPSASQLIELLRDPEWRPQIHDLSVYLRLTHFLPQASRERFLERNGNEQWSLLQGPAGVERLDRQRKLLDDGKARNAFVRHIAKLENRQQEAANKIGEWKKLLADQARWGNMAAAAAEISPDELLRILMDLESVVPQYEVKIGSDQPVQKLAAMRASAESNSASLRNGHRHLEQLTSNASRYVELTQRIEAMKKTQENDQKELEEMRQIQESEKAKLSSVQRAVSEVESKRGAASQLAILAQTALESESRRIGVSNQRNSLIETIEGWTKKLTELEQSRVAYRRQKEDYDTAVKGLELIRQNIVSNEEAEQALAAVNQAIYNHGRQANQEAELDERRRVLLAAKASLDQVIAGLNARSKDLTEALEVEQRSADEATRALGEVIQHLRAEDTLCPVCEHVYPPGELLRKAQSSIQRYSGRTAVLIQELRKLQREVGEASDRQALHSREIAEVEVWLGARARRGLEIEEQKQTLLRRPEFPGANLETLPLLLKERRAALNLQDQEFRAKVTSLAISDEVRFLVQHYEAQEKGLRAELQVAKNALSQADGVLQEWQAKLANLAEFIKVGGGLENLAKYRSERLEEVANIDREFNDLQTEWKEHDRKLQSALATSAERASRNEAAEKLLAELRAESNKLLKDWQLVLEGEPNESAVHEARLRVESKINDSNMVLEHIKKTVEGVEAWERRTQVVMLDQTVEEWMKKLGVKTKELCTELLEKQFETESLAVERAKAAQTRAVDVGRELTALAGRFSKTALEPLSAKVSSYNRVISPFPYEFRLSPHITSTRTSTRTRVRMPSVNSDLILERDPEWWLSEGQMSAIGLSVLLGASTVYRWSRWRALLLDDPLQNTDLIHAAAFGDVIRGLMRDEGYQVIVSTHNLDEADFLVRKCRRADLPIRRIELLSLGPSGLRYNCRDC